MTHSTPDVLALLALGEEVDPADAGHIPTCAQCRTELAGLRQVVSIGRSTTEQDVLVSPSPAVWDRIRAEVQASGGPAVLPRRSPDDLEPHRARRRWTTVALAAALALIVGLGAGFGISRVLTPKTPAAGPTTLNALPRWPGASGTASVETDAHGARTLVVTVEVPPTISVDGRMEVWLSDSRARDMTAMGFMPGTTGRFPIPASMDLKTHPLVDVSLEPQNDPDPAHSDDSVVRAGSPSEVTEAFVKQAGGGTPADFFAVEAAGLRWLAAAGPGAARTVEVLEVSAERIVLERLDPARPTRRAAEAFGRALARTHAAGADAFGAGPPGVAGDGYIGRQRMTLRPTPTWGAFYADQRVLPYARAAERLGHLSRAGLAAVERVAARLHAGELDDDRPPARIHGDLWSGNVLWTAAGAVLIDPAAHGGHGLTDLAMLDLFGAPGLEAVSAGYAEAAGLEPGWEQLIGLHQLHPLLVHAVSHGAGYGAEAAQVAARYA